MQRRKGGRPYASQNRPQSSRPSRSTYSNRSGRPSRPKFYKLTCSGCGKEVIVEVAPPDDKKLLCMDCFRK